MQGKFKLDYDFVEDLFFLYNEEKKSKGSVEFGDLVVDVGADCSIVGMEIFEASKYLSGLTNKRITKETLSRARNASFSFTRKKGTVLVKIVLPIDNERVPATIAIPSVGYTSPALAVAR